MTERLMIIIPPYYNIKDIKNITKQNPVITLPYGVLSICAYAKKHCSKELEFCILDLNLILCKQLSFSENPLKDLKDLISKRIEEFVPTYVGISALFNVQYNYLSFLEECLADLNIPIFLGGGLGTNYYEKILNDFKFINYICYGEGEKPVLELIDAEDPYALALKSVAWITKEKLETEFTPKHHFIENLDEVPCFDYSLLDFNLYGGRTSDIRVKNQKNVEVSIHTSRGCPFNCVFCSNFTIHGKKIRYMSIDKVLDEIHYMIDTWNMNTLLIEDDHFLSDVPKAKNILKELSKLNIRIEFPNGIAVYAVDDEIADLMQQAGVTTVSLAIESGSNYVLKNIIDKPLNKEMIYKASKAFQKFGIDVHAFIVIGLPGEIEKHRDETLELLHNADIDWTHVFIATPIFGSRLYNICVENNYLLNSNDFDNFSTDKCNIKTNDIDPLMIEKTAYLMNLDVNFINNYNVRNGKVNKAISYFNHVVSAYPNHAIGHYCLASALKRANGDDNKIKYHFKQFDEIIEKDISWHEYAKHFSII